MKRIVIYGDVNANLIDGSTVWLASISEIMSRIFDEVHVPLKFPIQNLRLLSRLEALDNVFLHEPESSNAEKEGMSIAEATEHIHKICQRIRPRVLLVRGFEINHELIKVPNLAAVLWPYITDLPYPPTRLSPTNTVRLGRVATRCAQMFTQTEASRSYLESIAPQISGRAHLMHPMIPDSMYVELNDVENREQSDVLRLVYAGKLAKDWRTLEMLELPRALDSLGIKATLTVIGDKIQRDRNDRGWSERMRKKLVALDKATDSGVRWLGGIPREQVAQVLKTSDIGIGWRSAKLDSSLEISTKFLEYAACGVVPLVNRTLDHVEELGENYPFFVSSTNTVEEVAQSIADNCQLQDLARERAYRFARRYSMSDAEKRLTRTFDHIGILNEKQSPVSQLTRLLIASHDLKFLGDLVDQVRMDPSFELQLDQWQSLHDHDEEMSSDLAAWADTVFCEWAGPSVVWYSNNKRPGTRLVVRLHGFELRGSWLNSVDYSQVDEFIFVSDFYRNQAIYQLELDPARCVVISNSIDVKDLARPKLKNSQFHIGLLGYVPFIKRPDRALNVLHTLLEHDDRFILHVKGQPPWFYPYEWKKSLQRQQYLETYARIANDPRLRDHVVFEDFSPSVANWFRKIGFILSPSDRETFHLAVAEGMASRAVPIVWDRDGSREIFSDEYVVTSDEEAIARIINIVQSNRWNEVGEQAHEYVNQWDRRLIYSQWLRILSRSQQ